MITNKNAKVSMHLAEAVGYQGSTLSIMDNTPLSRLLMVSTGLDDDGTVTDIVNKSMGQNRVDGTHGSFKKDIVKAAVTSLGASISLARNVINPLRVELQERITKAVTDTIVIDAKAQNIRPLAYPTLFNDAMFLDLVKGYKLKTILPTKELYSTLKLVEGLLTTADALELMKTGSATVDQRVTSYIEASVTSTWDDSELRNITAAEEPDTLSLRECISLMLMITGILTGRLDKVNFINEDTTNVNNLKITRGRLAKRIEHLLSIYNRDIENGVMVVRNPAIANSAYNEIVVYNKAYMTWLKAGGSPEALLGLFMKVTDGSRSYITTGEVKMLKEHPERYVSAYNDRMRISRVKAAQSEVGIVNRAVRMFLFAEIKELDVEPAVKAEYSTRANKALSVPYTTSDDIPRYVLTVVTSTFTANRDVKKILMELDKVLLSQGEEVDMQAALTYAMVTMVSRWIASQLILTKPTEY